MRELKQQLHCKRAEGAQRRTLPRVRELKRLVYSIACLPLCGRTLPRVRELKLMATQTPPNPKYVAPFPGCVN